MSIRLVILQVAILTLRMARKVRTAKDVNRTFFCDAPVCALSIGTHASRCRIGPDWSALFLCCLSRLVLSVERRRMKASLAAIESAENVGLAPRLHRQPSASRSLQFHSVISSIMNPHRGPASVSSSDPPFSLFTLWVWMTAVWLS
jgi:hypothetical protein